MKIKLPENVSNIIERLEAAGYEAYAVGGCVRDSILGREPNDWDITTSALPERVKELFPRTIDTGIKHGTVSILIGKETYEVTTYRVDGKYSDSRHPDSVSFTRSLTEDLKRRDFTINAMAYNDREGLVDRFDGAGDLERHIVRCVGVAHERFGEDALRILRAVRFAAQLDFTIDTETALAAAALAPNLAGISAERIHAELDKLLLSRCPDMIMSIKALGMSQVILPELDSYSDEDPEQNSGRKEKLPRLLADSPSIGYIRWAILFACIGNGREIMHRLKFDNRSIFMITLLMDHADLDVSELSDTAMRQLMHEVSKENVELLLTFLKYLRGIDITGAVAQYARISAAGNCTSLKELAVSGSDLIAHGFEPGKTLGGIMDMLLDAVIEDPSLNTDEKLLELAEKFRERV